MNAQPGRIATATPPRGPSPVIGAPLRRSRPRWIKWALFLLLAAVITVSGLLGRAHLAKAIEYETVPVESGSIQAKVTATGTLNAVVDVLVSSQVSGNIKTLYADWNSKVKKGQLIALIDPEIFQAQADQASATLHAAHAATITAQAQLEMARTNLNTATANEKNAEAIAAKDIANEINAKGQWEKDTQANLLSEKEIGTKAVAQQDVDTAKANYDAFQAQVTADNAQIDAAKQNIKSAQASVEVAQSQLDAAQAQEREAQAALKQAQINLDHCQIYAPVDGTVIARRMDVGQTVASTLNPPTIFEIAQDLTKMQVDTNVDESDVGGIIQGQKATFTVDSYPSVTFQGMVSDIRKAPIVTQNVVTYDVVITVDNSGLRLLPGMTANAAILTTKIDRTFKVPNSVLLFRPSAAVLKQTGLPPVQPDKPQLYELIRGKLTAIPVKFGLSDGKYTAISGDQIQSGAQVVVRATIGGASSSNPSPSSPPIPRM